MRIDRPVGNDLVNKSIAGNENNRSEMTKKPIADNVSKSVEVIPQQQSKIDAVLESADINMPAVDAARKAIADGTLDTPEAAQEAARNILELGL